MSTSTGSNITHRTRGASTLVRRLATGAALALVLFATAGTSDPFAAKAAAAGLTTKPDIKGCFVWGGVTYANQPAFLEVWNGTTSKWEVTRSANTASNGCIRFNDISVHRYYRIEGYKFYGYPLCYFYDGPSGYIYTSSGNDTLYNVGTTRLTGPYSIGSC